MISIDTMRLHLRNLSRNDADMMFDYRNNEICSHFQRGQTTDYEEIVNLIDRHENDNLSIESPCMVAVALKDTNEIIGEYAFGKWTTQETDEEFAQLSN